MTQLWEILVPASKRDKEFSYEHHKEWDAYVRGIAGGLTVYRAAKGEWVSPEGHLFKDRMIPVRIACSEEEIKTIMEFTQKHYDQVAVFAYLISERVIMWPLNNES